MSTIFLILNKIIDFIKGHKQLVLMIGIITLSALYLQQCQKTRNAEKQSLAHLTIAKQNIQALTDQTYQLQLTKKELQKADADLYAATVRFEQLMKTKAKEITKTKIVYKDTTIISDNTVEQKPNSDTVKISFSSKDLVRSFDVDNYVLLVRDTAGTYRIVKDHSDVKNFKLNFDIVFGEYKDNKGFDRVKVYAVNNETNKEIPESVLKLTWKNVELLNKPFEPVVTKRKFWASGFGISVNPIGVFPMYNNGQMKMVFMPNISFGYYFGINLNK